MLGSVPARSVRWRCGSKKCTFKFNRDFENSSSEQWTLVQQTAHTNLLIAAHKMGNCSLNQQLTAHKTKCNSHSSRNCFQNKWLLTKQAVYQTRNPAKERLLTRHGTTHMQKSSRSQARNFDKNSRKRDDSESTKLLRKEATVCRISLPWFQRWTRCNFGIRRREVIWCRDQDRYLSFCIMLVMQQHTMHNHR